MLSGSFATVKAKETWSGLPRRETQRSSRLPLATWTFRCPRWVDGKHRRSAPGFASGRTLAFAVMMNGMPLEFVPPDRIVSPAYALQDAVVEALADSYVYSGTVDGYHLYRPAPTDSHTREG